MRKDQISKNDISKENGISMVALVVTIIVLLILAGVTVSFIGGESGIVTNANKASKNSEKATLKEVIQTSYSFDENNAGKLELNETKDIITRELQQRGYQDVNVEMTSKKIKVVATTPGNSTYTFLVDEFGNIIEDDSNNQLPENENIENIEPTDTVAKTNHKAVIHFSSYAGEYEEFSDGIWGLTVKNEKEFSNYEYILNNNTSAQLKTSIIEFFNKMFKIEEIIRKQFDYTMQNINETELASNADMQSMFDSWKNKSNALDTLGLFDENKNIIQFSNYEQLVRFIKNNADEILENSLFMNIIMGESDDMDFLIELLSPLDQVEENTIKACIEYHLEWAKENIYKNDDGTYNETEYNNYKEEIESTIILDTEETIMSSILPFMIVTLEEGKKELSRQPSSDMQTIIENISNVFIPFVLENKKEGFVTLSQNELSKHLTGVTLTLSEDSLVSVNTKNIDVENSPYIAGNLNNLINNIKKANGYDIGNIEAYVTMQEINGGNPIKFILSRYDLDSNEVYLIPENNGNFNFSEILSGDTEATILLNIGNREIYKETKTLKELYTTWYNKKN